MPHRVQEKRLSSSRHEYIKKRTIVLF